MIRDLPRDARYPVLLAWQKKKNAKTEEPEGGPEYDEEAMERWEMRQWSSLERELLAGQLNTLNNLLRFVPEWKKRPPESPVVGPVEWWPEEQLRNRNKKLQKKKKEAHGTGGPSVGEVMAAFGYSGN